MAGKFAVVIFLTFLFGLCQLATAADWDTASDGRQYLIETSVGYNWLQAVDQCSRRGLQLVVIDNEVKNNAIIDLIKSKFGSAKDLWVGHHDEYNTKKDKNRPWYSIATGQEITFSNWYISEPNNYKSQEHCAEIKSSARFQWYDESCTDSYYGYICEEHYKTTQCHNDVQAKRYSTNEKNALLSSDFTETQTNIQNQLNQTRNETNAALLNWNKSSKVVFENFKKSLDGYLKKKPYLQAVVADIGDDINALAVEAENEILNLNQQTQESLANVQLNAEQSITNETLAFAEKIKIHNNEVDSLMSY
uniref:C-type lectin domain-containing protein n=1 Tax=Musca domestica TaxID=7370 RepID=A0A1I8MY01_MUSDO